MSYRDHDAMQFQDLVWPRSQTTSHDLKRLASTSSFRVGLVMIDFGDRFWRKTLEISRNSLFFVRCVFQGKRGTIDFFEQKQANRTKATY